MRDDLNASALQSLQCLLHAGLSHLRCARPSGCFEKHQPPRTRSGRRLRRAYKAGCSRVAAHPRDDLVGHLPGILKAGRENAGTTLALVIVAALAIERVDCRLETEAAAKA